MPASGAAGRTRAGDAVIGTPILALAIGCLASVIPELAVQSATVVHYRDLPSEIVSASVYRWRDAAAPLRVASTPVQPGKPLDLAVASGERLVVVLARADGAYLLDGPVTSFDSDDRMVDIQWRRTVGGRSDGGPPHDLPFEWLSAVHEAGGAWPRCLWADTERWECWGVGTDDVGVILASGPGALWWTVASAGEVREWRAGEWGRLLAIRAHDGSSPIGIRLVLAQPVPPPPQRLQSVRLDTTAVTAISATHIAAGAVWVAGARPPPHGWAEIRANGEAPKYVLLEDVAAGPAALRMPILLDQTRRIEGIVTGSSVPARGTIVTLFRLIDPPPRPNDPMKPRRVFAAESTTETDGAYRFEDLGIADYEVVAWHPQLGHATVFVPAEAEKLDIQLQLPGIARGRVLQDGVPVSGAGVFSLPDPSAFNSAPDPVDVKGGDTRTGEDGRFVVSLAPLGGGELRIGGEQYPVKRVPLPRTVLPIVDIGVIDLGASLQITAVLDVDPGCDLRAVGPAGRTGLHVLSAARTGPAVFKLAIPEEGIWEFGLSCAGIARALVPSVVRIGPANVGKDVHFAVK